MEATRELAEKLCESSVRNYHNIYEYVVWPASVDPEAEWFMSPELCSLFGTEVWELIEEPARKRLAFFEAVNFFSLNIHGETALMQGLASRLYAPRNNGLSAYLHHFLDEENKHCILFGTFCERFARKVYADRKLVTGAQSPDVKREDFLFFARVLIFEEIVDQYNLIMSKDARLHPLAVAINRNHHVEEARHLAFGRQICAELWQQCVASWTPEERDDVRDYLQQFLVTTWREYYNPDVYRDAALAEALRGRWEPCDEWSIQKQAWGHEQGVRRRASVSERCVKFLERSGILSQVRVP